MTAAVPQPDTDSVEICYLYIIDLLHHQTASLDQARRVKKYLIHVNHHLDHTITNYSPAGQQLLRDLRDTAWSAMQRAHRNAAQRSTREMELSAAGLTADEITQTLAGETRRAKPAARTHQNHIAALPPGRPLTRSQGIGY
ncbi:hypothetical protein [Nocardia wallacei]|uniref:hypothetical protein n=1 Tax=Nocardia wallacei TaxID=480035 RepID=UPI002456E1C6|nr:hypothetical protein [Nocardia wallacei]